MKVFYLSCSEAPGRCILSMPHFVMTKRPNAKLSALFGFGMAAGVFYGMYFRPWLTNWGASWEESRMALTGDDLAPDCRYRATRAVSIDAPVEVVWQCPVLPELFDVEKRSGLVSSANACWGATGRNLL